MVSAPEYQLINLESFSYSSLPNVSSFGSITICKAIIDEEGNLVDGSEVDATFSITDIDAGDQVGLLGTTTFSTPLNFNYDLFGSDNVNDAECVTHNDLTIGLYNYTEETITSSGDWEAPLYNDQFSTQVVDLDDFFSYAYYTNENGTNADGRIILTENRPDRTLILLNEYEVEDVVEETITISATKIVCDDEASLPNWGASNSNFKISS